MEKTTKETTASKVTSWSIIGLVVAGTLLISGVADLSQGNSVMAKLFLIFLAAIIVVQVIPGIMLLSAMAKGIYSMFSKKEKLPATAHKK